VGVYVSAEEHIANINRLEALVSRYNANVGGAGGDYPACLPQESLVEGLVAAAEQLIRQAIPNPWEGVTRYMYAEAPKYFLDQLAVAIDRASACMATAQGLSTYTSSSGTTQPTSSVPQPPVTSSTTTVGGNGSGGAMVLTMAGLGILGYSLYRLFRR